VHLTIGIVIVTIAAVLAANGHFLQQRHIPLEMIGLYWHFVDMVWMFLLPLLYLFGFHA
jgi:heme/copper-type cytochrome/quinol oxidase subunit 3